MANDSREIRCAGCETLLDEANREREPCPECGSTARRVSITLHDTVDVASEDTSFTINQTLPRLHQRMVGHVEEAQAVLPSVVRRLEWLQPTDPGGSYTLMVYGSNDELLGMTEDASWRKALWGLREKLAPS